jgi:general secretion pathway protein N
MSAWRTGLYVAIAASLALSANAAAQMRVAIVSPTVTPDQLESPLPSAPAPPLQTVPPPDPAAGAARPPAPVANEPRGNPLWAIPLKLLSFTRERPLFTPSRRPPAPAVARVEPQRPLVLPSPAAAETPRLALVGLIVGGTEGIAIFVDQTTREVVRLRTNEGHGGWILRSIQGREATLEKTPFSAVLAIPPPGREQKPGPVPGRPEPNL